MGPVLETPSAQQVPGSLIAGPVFPRFFAAADRAFTSAGRYTDEMFRT
jgi:hypothetical protein